MSVMPAPASSAPESIRFGPSERLKTALIAGAFFAAFWDLLSFAPGRWGELVYAWLFASDWSHGPLIPVFSAYLIYSRWEYIRATPVRGAWLGVAPLLAGLAIYLWALSGNLPFGYARPLAMMIALLGLLILAFGVKPWRHLWLPWAYLFFAIPMPQRLYFALTNPLRRLAATVASAMLSVVPDLHVERVGSNLSWEYRNLAGVIGVADACSGMRSTVTLCALGVAVAFMSDRPRWQRIVLVLACVPIATFCNMIRVTTTCFLHVFVDPKYAEGNYHMMLGLAVILLAFGIFNGLGWVLNQIVVEDDVKTEAAAR